MKTLVITLLLASAVIVCWPGTMRAQELPVYLRDRGTGIPVSQFGTYIEKGQLLIYPFYEYYHDNNFEYEPADFGFGSMQELRGRYRAHEGLIFLGYGLSDRLAVEFEAGIISAKLAKSPSDTTGMPDTLKADGLSDVEAQLRWRWNRESASSPEFFNYFETVFPTGEKNSLIGTADWEFKLGFGVVKGYSWGTITARAAVEYDAAEKTIGPGEYAFEYLKRVSPSFRLFAMVEGSEDEIALIPEIQWHLSHNVFLKGNVGFGLTSKATDYAPEVGVMIVLP
jgi:hypothetical protein